MCGIEFIWAGDLYDTRFAAAEASWLREPAPAVERRVMASVYKRVLMYLPSISSAGRPSLPSEQEFSDLAGALSHLHSVALVDRRIETRCK